MPFFETYMRELLKGGKKLSKIVGHPISLLLVLLVGRDGKYNDAVGEVIRNYRQLLKEVKIIGNKSMEAGKQKAEVHLYRLIQRTLSEQNLL